MADPGLDRSDWIEKLEQLGRVLKKSGIQVEIVVLGSVPNILAGQPGRTTLDMDVWKPSSDFSEKELAKAARKVGLLFDPKGAVDPDMPYLQIVRPGIVQLGEFTAAPLERFGGLLMSRPPVENLIASKLCRATEKDVEDIAWLASQHRPDKSKIIQIIQTFPYPQRETAMENMVYLETIIPPSQPRRKKPEGRSFRSGKTTG